MQLNRHQLAALGLRAGTISGIALAFLLSGTYVKVSIEVDTRDTVKTAIGSDTHNLDAPKLRFE